MNDIIYADLLFTMGSVMVYELKPSSFTLFSRPTYFWKYKNSPDFFGPFDSVMNATKHWESTVVPPSSLVANNVIKVDFKAKRRIK